MKFTGTMKKINGELHIGDLSVEELKKKYGTPLYIYDLQFMEERIKEIVDNFKSESFNTRVVYASKAYLSQGICQVMEKFNVHMDAVSLGELFIIKSSGFPMKKVHMHGNNKTLEELEACFEYGVGSIIIDSFDEARNISELSKKYNKSMDVYLRLNIGIEAHTHEYIKTSKHSSKFGVSIFNNEAKNILSFIKPEPNMNFLGFHCHIGSQIFDELAFCESIEIMTSFTKKMSDELNLDIPEINLGGGFGVRYTDEDTEIDYKSFMKKLVNCLEKNISEKNLNIKNVTIEPGRSIVAQAGSTLYTVGGIKNTYGEVKYLFVDGGMTDNIRTALYQAKYEACIANRLDVEEKEIVTIAGKCCESGDVIAKSIKLTKSDVEDMILVNCTGAYGHSMSSNYNKALKPPVVFVKNGESYLVSKRESCESLIKDDEKLPINF